MKLRIKRIRRIPVREASKNKPAKFSQTKLVLLAGIIVLIVAAKTLHSYLLNAELFRVREVKVYGYTKSGGTDFSELEGVKGKNIFKLDIEHIRRRLEQHTPEIKAVWVRRNLPDQIAVTVAERTPLAQLAAWSTMLVGIRICTKERTRLCRFSAHYRH
jgi:cell division septal protein FtsQ